MSLVDQLASRPVGTTAGQMREAASLIRDAEEALGNNLVWLADALDLRIRQGDKETIRRLGELDAVWAKLAKAVT